MNVDSAPSRIRDLFLLCFLALQFGLPLHYYLGSDPFDERFAWRMFSPLRMAECEVRFTQAGRKVERSQRFHLVWNKLADRGRDQVLRRMADQLCAEQGPVTLQAICTLPDGGQRHLYDGDTDQCGETP